MCRGVGSLGTLGSRSLAWQERAARVKAGSLELQSRSCYLLVVLIRHAYFGKRVRASRCSPH